MQSHGIFAVGGVQFHDDLVGKAANGGSDPSGGRQINFTVGRDLAGFDDGHVYFAHEPVTDFLGHLGQVDVVVGDFPIVHRLAEVNVGGVGGAVANSLGAGKNPVAGIARGSTGEDAHLEGVPLSVFRFCNFCQFSRHSLGRPCGSKPAQANVVAVFNQACCFFWC